ncbi:hypothetical protein M1O19_04505 [Dehalococcoidia bacterium]|nr:hypothetical protein [Dehalococcoidia bacterium]MCL0060815.1 hypothetical protein [Dehalococcoidia bacterium]MCL0073343.1 hypothetical protein [Dehalococcoidia bacterium]MCL0077073.1 hypothetical protein [Dehalococcoidia bacterium]MCL0097761.1 hypothetical protein [Dehalococcoidia bacterium]
MNIRGDIIEGGYLKYTIKKLKSSGAVEYNKSKEAGGIYEIHDTDRKFNKKL